MNRNAPFSPQLTCALTQVTVGASCTEPSTLSELRSRCNHGNTTQGLEENTQAKRYKMGKQTYSNLEIVQVITLQIVHNYFNESN